MHCTYTAKLSSPIKVISNRLESKLHLCDFHQEYSINHKNITWFRFESILCASLEFRIASRSGWIYLYYAHGYLVEYVTNFLINYDLISLLLLLLLFTWHHLFQFISFAIFHNASVLLSVLRRFEANLLIWHIYRSVALFSIPSSCS